MSDRTKDELVLIDYLTGRCDEQTRLEVAKRLKTDEAFSALRQDMANTLAAMDLAPQPEAPADLAERTMERIFRQTAAAGKASRRDLTWRGIRPTFSFRELATVASVILILSAIFIPSLRQSRRQRNAVLCASQVGQIGSALQTYANSYNGYLPVPYGSSPRWLPAPGEPVSSNSTAMYRLVKLKIIEPVMFQCPSVGQNSFVILERMNDFPSGKYVHYSYQYSLGPGDLAIHNPALKGSAGRMVILADMTPLFRNGQFQPERVHDTTSSNHDHRGQNVLYLDMHVNWANTASAGVGDDNIFLVKGVYDYKGTEAPQDPSDTFLMPAYSSDTKSDE